MKPSPSLQTLPAELLLLLLLQGALIKGSGWLVPELAAERLEIELEGDSRSCSSPKQLWRQYVVSNLWMPSMFLSNMCPDMQWSRVSGCMVQGVCVTCFMCAYAAACVPAVFWCAWVRGCVCACAGGRARRGQQELQQPKQL
jgi:hypothetical protein